MHKKFTIEEQYKLYLKRMNLDEGKMHPVQKKQLKQTFYGAFGQLLILMRDETAALTEEEGMQVLNAQMMEVIDFFKAESQPIKDAKVNTKGEC